jgi:hypothetical protein
MVTQHGQSAEQDSPEPLKAWNRKVSPPARGLRLCDLVDECADNPLRLSRFTGIVHSPGSTAPVINNRGRGLPVVAANFYSFNRGAKRKKQVEKLSSGSQIRKPWLKTAIGHQSSLRV